MRIEFGALMSLSLLLIPSPTAKYLAERQGFEPWRRFPAYTRSRRAPSTTRPPLRRNVSYIRLSATIKISRELFCIVASRSVRHLFLRISMHNSTSRPAS